MCGSCGPRCRRALPHKGTRWVASPTAPSPLQGGSLAQHISIGSANLTISSRVARLLLALVRLPGYLFNLVTFRAQQIMLGNTFTKLVCAPLQPACPVPDPASRLHRPVFHQIFSPSWERMAEVGMGEGA